MAVAIITGASKGFGRALAEDLARDGWDLVVDARHGGELEDAAAALRTRGTHVRAIAGDVRDAGHREQLVGAATALGGLDLLVNNAAYQMAQPGGLADITTEQFDRVLKTNLYGMFWVTKAALEHLKEGASIVNSSSIQAYQPSPELLDYAMTKGAIVNFTKGLAQALAEKGIRVNTVAPGPVWTPLIPATMPSEKVSSFGEQTPLGRAAQPAELAPAYVFFASQESSYVTAQVLGVTGGSPLA
jgi:NAD(P)-dependent dehydrogenase (short-subunit alcohol dehydrogenase family)